MTPLDLLANGFSRIPAVMGRATDGLSAEHLATPPAPGTNSIGWLAWHTARGQDAWISDLDGTEAVWTAGGWYGIIGVPFAPDENGFGMPFSDTTRIVASAELLAQYLAAVTSRTLAYLDTLTDTDLDVIVDPLRHPPVSRGVQLLSILDDGLQHSGQAGYARGILERSGLRATGCPEN